MAEPRTFLHTWKRSIIVLVVVLVNIPLRLYAVKLTRKWLHSSFESTKICRSADCKFSSGW